MPKVNDAPADMRAEVRAKQNACAAALQSALALDSPPAPEPTVDYHAHPALSASDIRRGYHVPEAALWERLYPSEETQAMRNGTALHYAILEPERYAERVAVKPEGMTFVTKEGKEWRAAHADQIIVPADIHARAAVYAAASRGIMLLLGVTTPKFEAPLFWTDEPGDCRCKPDLHWIDADGTPCLVSVKTTAKPMTANEWAATLASTPRGPGYDIGEYHYLRGLAAVYLGTPDRWQEVRMHHLVLSTDGPPMATIYDIGLAVLERAAVIWHDKAPRIAEALRNPMPPVIVQRGLISDVPRWAKMPDSEVEA